MSRAAVTALMFAGALAAGGCDGEKPAPPPLRAVTVVKVSVSAAAGQAAYSGDVRARYETALSFRVGGKLIERKVDVGSVVESGAALARLDPEDQKLNTRAVRSRLAAADAAYKQARSDLARYTDLYKKNFISRAEFDRHTTDYDVAKAQLEQVKAELAVVENQADYTVLRADHAGVVTGIEAEVGQVVAAGQAVVRVARTGEKEVAINVPENRLDELQRASGISVTLWADPSVRYRGKVREISPVADQVTRTYAVRIALADADQTVKLGMTANAYLEGISMGGVVELPAAAVFQQGQGAAVWRVDPQSGQVSAVEVTVVRYFEDKVAVTGALNEGDAVVRAGVHQLFEGETVRVLDEAGR